MPKLTCEETRELAPEMALGTISGDERARLIEHIASCAQCRVLVEDMSRVADSVLLLGPEHEPPGGFESKVLGGFHAPHRRRAWFGVAASLAAAAIAAAAVLWITADERDVAAHYQAALEEANGEYFGVRALHSVDGAKVGNAFAYEGNPSWVFVVFDEAEAVEYRVQLVASDGERSDLGKFELSPDKATWGAEIDVSLRQVAALRFVTADGDAIEARFDDD